jgi:large subunit ribosomal protein L6e
MYPADDIKVHPHKESKIPKITKLRNSITPGTVLIILAGRFKGRRVVFLKQLESGLLLVTGPYQVNGVPLRRVNQAYCIATSTKIDLTGVDANKVSDAYFAKTKKEAKKVDGLTFFRRSDERTEEDLKNIQKKKETQIQFDQALLKNIKAQGQLISKYLQTRFSLRKNMKPHEMKF